MLRVKTPYPSLRITQTMTAPSPPLITTDDLTRRTEISMKNAKCEIPDSRFENATRIASRSRCRGFFLCVLLAMLGARIATFGETAFTYQGRLSDGNSGANG